MARLWRAAVRSAHHVWMNSLRTMSMCVPFQRERRQDVCRCLLSSAVRGLVRGWLPLRVRLSIANVGTMCAFRWIREMLLQHHCLDVSQKHGRISRAARTN